MTRRHEHTTVLQQRNYYNAYIFPVAAYIVNRRTTVGAVYKFVFLFPDIAYYKLSGDIESTLI